MDFIMKASGAEKAMELVYQDETKQIMERIQGASNSSPLGFTKDNVTEILGNKSRDLIETWEQLYSSYR